MVHVGIHLYAVDTKSPDPSAMVVSIAYGQHSEQYGPSLTVRDCEYLRTLVFNRYTVLRGYNILWLFVDLCRLLDMTIDHAMPALQEVAEYQKPRWPWREAGAWEIAMRGERQRKRGRRAVGVEEGWVSVQDEVINERNVVRIVTNRGYSFPLF